MSTEHCQTACTVREVYGTSLQLDAGVYSDCSVAAYILVVWCVRTHLLIGECHNINLRGPPSDPEQAEVDMQVFNDQ